MTDNSKYIRFDWAIKRILRDKANKKVLEGLIGVLLKEPVTITEILESENNKYRRDDKDNRVDVKAKTGNGEIIIVEVQLTKEKDFFHRILFGTTTAINDQISIGQDYSVIKKVYSINVLYFDFGNGDDYAYHGYMEFRGMTKEGSVLSFKNNNEREYVRKNASRVYAPEEVFPEYFLLRVNQFNDVAKTPIEEWMAYLKDGSIKENTTDPGLQEARRKLAVMSMSDEERRAYREYMVSVRAAKDAYETARDDGYDDGYEVGWVKGRAEGEAKGRTATNIDHARKMKSLGASTDFISQVTGLTPDEIERL